MAGAAVDLLIERIRNPEKPFEKKTFGLELMIREST